MPGGGLALRRSSPTGRACGTARRSPAGVEDEACARACFHSVNFVCELGCAPPDCPGGAEDAAPAGGRWPVAGGEVERNRWLLAGARRWMRG